MKSPAKENLAIQPHCYRTHICTFNTAHFKHLLRLQLPHGGQPTTHQKTNITIITRTNTNINTDTYFGSKMRSLNIDYGHLVCGFKSVSLEGCIR